MATFPAPLVFEPAFVPFRLLAIGGSAGGIGALREVLSRLPKSFAVPIVVIQHLSADFASRLPEVLAFRTPLRCKWSEDGERPQAGTVTVARPGTNLALTREQTLLHLPGAKPRLGWPSIDIFLRSMASHVGDRSIAVILSGMMHDGADGIIAVRQAGGATMVQHPRCARHPDMPNAAIDLGRADLARTAAEIAEAVQILAEFGVV